MSTTTSIGQIHLPLYILMIIIGIYGLFSLTALGWINDFEKENLERDFTQRTYYQQIEINKLRNELGYQIEKEAILSDELQEKERALEKLDNRVDNYKDDIKALEKIVETDPELLQKYSKIFFLNEHYTPEKLVTIDEKWVDETKSELQIQRKVERFLENLLKDAEDDDIDLRILSAYRSFDTQSGLKSSYKITYGTASNTFSADQGYSEHQLGTTVDFTTAERIGRLDGFETTEAYEWLLKNAHKYGFILSYDKNNSYYIFEPWHWRFVGKELADDLHDDNETFYSLDQRKIDEYLGNIFNR